MSLQEIYNDLNNALHDGVIVLSASTVPDLGLTLEALGIKGSGTLTMTGATLTLGPRSVVLTAAISPASLADNTGSGIAGDLIHRTASPSSETSAGRTAAIQISSGGR